MTKGIFLTINSLGAVIDRYEIVDSVGNKPGSIDISSPPCLEREGESRRTRKESNREREVLPSSAPSSGTPSSDGAREGEGGENSPIVSMESGI